MIKVRDLCFNYGKETALKNLNLDIPKNTTCAIIGPSGCGKTTLLYILAGLFMQDSGKVEIGGSELKGIRNETGLILQNLGLLPWKNIYENTALGLKARRVDKKSVNEKVSSVLKELRISEYKDKFPDQLSGGQRQRVAIARTLVTEPDVLLLDEASSALDAMTKEYIQNLILEIYKKRPVTMMMVTHSIEEAVFLGQQIVVMEKASIKHIINNPYFGDEEIRFKPEYYDICLKLRKLLYEGDNI